MSSLKFSPRSLRLQPEAPGLRRQAAVALRGLSAVLARLARRLAEPASRRRGEPLLEFYAEAGAPEGALYSDGKLVGFVAGVKRL